MGDPTPWTRARLSKTGYFYDSQKAFKNVMRNTIEDQHDNRPLFVGPVEMIVVFFMRLPDGKTLRERRAAQLYHCTKPDLDNLEKILKDVCSGIIYRDDCQVAQVFKKKIYDEHPRIEFSIRNL